jgi:hypothetical protein
MIDKLLCWQWKWKLDNNCSDGLGYTDNDNCDAI